MKAIARLLVFLLSLFVAMSSQAQRTTTHTDETSNNTTGCAMAASSYVGTTSCVAGADFPGANDDASAGTDRNVGANTIVFDAAPKNLADFSHDNVDIHQLVDNGFALTDR